MLNIFHHIANEITQTTGKRFTVTATQAVHGGDINQAFRLQSGQDNFFAKLNQTALAAMFTAEFKGLLALAETNTVKVPTPILAGQHAEYAYLVLEYIAFGQHTPGSEAHLGQQLAALHQKNQPYFGFVCQNTIGHTPQHNDKRADWPTFWRDLRLGYQLRLAADNGYSGKLQTMGDKLCADLEVFFAGYNPQPALVHGDLWQGNAATDQQGNPILFDPACYYGDRETDLAMTSLFGSFSQAFYAAYQAAYPLDPGYETRKSLYNLYHVLNHLNLFGGRYLKQAETMLAQLLAVIR